MFEVTFENGGVMTFYFDTFAEISPFFDELVMAAGGVDAKISVKMVEKPE